MSKNFKLFLEVNWNMLHNFDESNAKITDHLLNVSDATEIEEANADSSNGNGMISSTSSTLASASPSSSITLDDSTWSYFDCRPLSSKVETSDFEWIIKTEHH